MRWPQRANAPCRSAPWRYRLNGSPWFLAVALLGLTVTASASAEGDAEAATKEALVEETSVGEALAETAHPGWTYPKGYAQRPLVIDKHMVRGAFSIDVKRLSFSSSSGAGQTLVALDFGAAFSPLTNLEVGISNYRLGSTPPKASQGLVPIIVSPSADFGDIPIYGRYSFLRKDYVEMAIDLVMVLPSNTNFAITFGVPVRIRARPRVTIDTGMELSVLTKSAGANIELPVKGSFNITPAGFIFGESGFSFQNLGRNAITSTTSSSVPDSNVAFPVAKNQVFLPLGIGGGYTVVIKGKVMMDVFGRVGWNPLVYLNPPAGVKTVPGSDTWFIGVGTIVHTRPLLKANQS